MSWLEKGFEGVKKEAQRIASSRGPSRFWLKKDTTKLTVFVDDEPACIHEYNPKINGNWNNHFTSPKSDPDYPDLDAAMAVINKNLQGKYNPYYVGYLTVVDCSSYETKKGKKIQYELKLFCPKFNSLKLLQNRKEAFEGLAGKAIKITRTDNEKSANIGDVFDFDREVDMAKLWDVVMYQGKLLKEHFAEALEDEEKRAWLTRTFNFKKGEGGALLPEVPTFNYMELLKPMTPAQLRDFFGGAFVEESSFGGGSKSSSGGASVDEDVPF